MSPATVTMLIVINMWLSGLLWPVPWRRAESSSHCLTLVSQVLCMCHRNVNTIVRKLGPTRWPKLQEMVARGVRVHTGLFAPAVSVAGSASFQRGDPIVPRPRGKFSITVVPCKFCGHFLD